jgi:hypothetical protein
MLDRVPELDNFDLEEIAEALADQESYEHLRLVDPRSGEIVFWSADSGIDGHNRVDLEELDPDLVAIQPLPSWVWYEDMADFADTIADEQVGQRLARAIQGKGAFRRFKDELHHRPELLLAWHAFSDTRARRRAVEWLAEHELINDEDARRYLTGHPDPQAR